MEFLSSEFLIPHGHCYLWNPGLLSLHAIADLIIVLSYYAIPITLIYFVRKRKDIPFGFTFILFSLFILACGTTHAFSIWTLWHPDYWASGLIKAITAIVSLYTAMHLVPLLPQALAMKSPAELEKINQELNLEIARRKEIEQALRESERNYRLLIDNMPNGAVFMFDRDLRYTIAGGTELQKVGFPKTSFEHKTIWEALPIETCEMVEPIYRQALAGETARSEIVFAERIYEVNSIPVTDPDGMVNAGLILTQNITQRKKSELQMLKALERQKQLSDLKSHIVTTISHQFRNPLAVINTAAETLSSYLDKLSKEKIDKRLQNIMLATQSMTMLMDEIMVFDRIESGQLTFAPQLVNLPNFYQEMLQSLPDGADARRSQASEMIEIDINNTCQEAYLDPKLVSLALKNLISNALKYSDPDLPIKITATCAENLIKIKVIDAGIGIAPEELAYIFDPFFRSERVENIQGTGFGLSIAKQAMQVHNGTIEVESELGKGSTFTLNLPYLTRPASNQA
ncbi:PAS/PAC sensor hybrid histidine kinase [Thalassoporum mexicanum PCC 7367]|uniref:sensor histidine kinase n=1 Tax=Thalassoporum mexicanum TaxID=3457544 RepID=UPI00029F8B19|nr:PAS domain-containing sensor histidine kinase [Pseudanabaena sp. PCC 7367]AFY71718.1 PAS/PAC sensor hybrid histidine kinase [Pseudanabaena sp. PCC 7367]